MADAARMRSPARGDPGRPGRDAKDAPSPPSGGAVHASEMNHAFLDAQEFRTARLLDRLAATRPGPGEADLRGWEWNYLDRLARSWTSEVQLDLDALPEWKAQPRPGSCVADPGRPPFAGTYFSSDGSRLIIPAYRPSQGWGGGLPTAPPASDPHRPRCPRAGRAAGRRGRRAAFSTRRPAGWSPASRSMARGRQTLPGHCPTIRRTTRRRPTRRRGTG